MAATLWVEVVASDRVVWEGDAVSVIARTTEGDIGILPGHEPLIAPLVPSAVEVTTPDGNREIIAVDGGFLSMTPTRCAIISPFARLAREVSLVEAEAELRDAQRALDAGDTDLETMHHLHRASAQIRAVAKIS